MMRKLVLTLELDLGDKSAGRDKEGKVQTHQKKKKKHSRENKHTKPFKTSEHFS